MDWMDVWGLRDRIGWDGWIDGWMRWMMDWMGYLIDGWTDGRMTKRICKDGIMDRWTDRKIVGIDGWMDGWDECSDWFGWNVWLK